MIPWLWSHTNIWLFTLLFSILDGFISHFIYFYLQYALNICLKLTILFSSEKKQIASSATLPRDFFCFVGFSPSLITTLSYNKTVFKILFLDLPYVE